MITDQVVGTRIYVLTDQYAPGKWQFRGLLPSKPTPLPNIQHPQSHLTLKDSFFQGLCSDCNHGRAVKSRPWLGLSQSPQKVQVETREVEASPSTTGRGVLYVPCSYFASPDRHNYIFWLVKGFETFASLPSSHSVLTHIQLLMQEHRKERHSIQLKIPATHNGTINALKDIDCRSKFSHFAALSGGPRLNAIMLLPRFHTTVPRTVRPPWQTSSKE